MSSIDLRASSSSGPRSSSEVPPRSEEKVRQSLATAVMSACLVIAQKPRPSPLVLPVHRVLAAQDREHLVRDAIGEAGVIGEIDVREPHLRDLDHQRCRMYSLEVPVGDVLAVALQLEPLHRQEGVDDLGPDRVADRRVGLERVERLAQRHRQRPALL